MAAFSCPICCLCRTTQLGGAVLVAFVVNSVAQPPFVRNPTFLVRFLL
ncbi:hypothetical protein BLL52_1626 [Rhodoferax antarcticus ANT.BR]|uniref:Uncharacterized protein n=1 Tax=Rhodoferax antarcticus ANT.BR TaxID=1111071 RepID=A0A1Q8YG65_9BURK|nr:hypothetical protein BLL52_1626 [Rhodoferax antarcticus ANT.BR]